MLLIFLWLLVTAFKSASGAEQETICTTNTCFTVHMAKVSFEVARQSCEHSGGYLMTIRDREEENVLRCLLAKIQRQHQERAQKFWIGLKLHKGDCVLAFQTLRGFKWISEEEGSSYSNWEKEPVHTCMGERCVRVLYSRENQLKWTDGPCKSPSFYVCKFYFKGMCKSLTLMGPGEISYTAPFSDKPRPYKMPLLPFGTYAEVLCRDQQSHLSLCRETAHGYQWSEPGPFCKAEKQNCTIHNGGCEHLCQQEAGGVQCFCKEGYSLGENGMSCRATETCRDDVCEQPRCHHGCSNSSGSLSCHCEPGFSLSQDGHSCVDINECTNSVCQFQCVNTEGSFRCTCPRGFHVDSDELTCTREMPEATPSDGQMEVERWQNFTESLSRSTVEPQHQSPPFPASLNFSESEQQSNSSLSASLAEVVNSRVLICVLGSVIPLLLLVAVTLAIAIFRCNQTKKEAKKNATTDGYCWVSPGLDPRLEKLYESILTDDL